jgi:hypothetical protein
MPQNGWYGVRFIDSEDESISDLEFVDFKHTFYAVSLDSLSGNIKNCDFVGLSGTSPGDIFLERDTRLVAGREWKFTDPTTVFKISPFTAFQPSWGVDAARNEILVNGIFRTETGASVTFASTKAPPAAGDWYGIRVPNFATQVFLSGVMTMQHARGGFVLENTDHAWPDLVALASGVTFANNLRDVTVAGDRVIGGASPTSLVTIPAGMKIGFTADSDNTAPPNGPGTVDPNRAELVIREGGQILAQATPNSMISFGSDHPVPGTDDWYGIRLTLDAVLSSGYGYCESAYSKFENVKVSDARYGFRIEGKDTTACAPTLDHVTFSNIEGNSEQVARHIYIDRADVHIPYGYYNGAYVESKAKWDLEAPTNVIFTNTVLPKKDSGDIGRPGKADLFVHGLLVTRAQSGPSQGARVVFRPETHHDSTGDDWGGIWVDFTGRATRIDYADIGHAINPLFFSWADSVFVRNSTIHHYKDDGIWVDTATLKGIMIKDCQILRGANLAANRGLAAIRAVKSSPLIIRDNLIYDYDLRGNGWIQSSVTGAAITIVNDNTWCLAVPENAQQVLIQGNDFVGPGDEYNIAVRTAIDLDWPCAGGGRTVVLKKNAIFEWSGAAIDMSQGIDVEVECNLIQDNFDGFLYSRNALPLKPASTLLTNRLVSNKERTIQTDTRDLLALGPNGPTTQDRGKNKIEIDPPDLDGQYYIHNNGTTGNSLDARDNQWVQVDGDGDIETVPDVVRTKIVGGATVLTENLITTNPYNILCVPAPPDSSPPSPQTSAVRGPRTTRIEDDGEDDGEHGAETVTLDRPRRTALERVAPTPFHGTTVIRFAVAEEVPVPVSLMIYDVTGRLVERLGKEPLPAGWYEVSWDGRSHRGDHVAAGVYFLRFEARGIRETRKIVYLK